MAKLYIGNCTQQVQSFMYRLPESSQVRTQHILIGGQTVISGDLNPIQIESIINQHAPYGLIAVDAIDRTRDFAGLCYSIDRPIAVDKIKKAIAHNADVLTMRGIEQRKEAAVAINNALEMQDEAGPFKGLEVSVMEENQHKHEGEAPIVAEGYRVSREAGQPTPPKSRRQARG